MLDRSKNWRRAGTALLFVGVSFLVTPPYKHYCESDHANNYYCAAYEVVAAFGDFAHAYEAAITALATALIAWFTLTLKRSTDLLGSIAGSTAKTQDRDTKILQRAYIGGHFWIKPKDGRFHVKRN